MATADDLARAQLAFRDTYGSKSWRLRHLYKIRDKKRRVSFLKPNNIQRRMEELTRDQNPLRALFLKYRQGGVSTYWLLHWLDDTIWTPTTITGVLAHELKSLRALFDIIDFAYRNMPPGLRPPLTEDTRSSFSFGGGLNSRIFVSLDIRSTVVHNLHISEWAHCEDKDIQASLGAVPPDGNITGESTANGVGNDFHITYQEGRLDLNEYRVAFYPWFIQDEYQIALNGMPDFRLTDEEREFIARVRADWGIEVTPEKILWRRSMRRKFRKLFPQEYPENDEQAFLTTGQFFFKQAKIIRLLNEAKAWAERTKPVEETDEWIAWERPIKGDLYVAGADPAEGVGNDYSVLAILNLTKRRQAAVYRGQVGVTKFARICAERCEEYRKALLGVERNNHGLTVNTLLDERHHYRPLYEEDRKTRLLVRPGAARIRREFGWSTTNANRTPLLDAFKAAVEGDEDDDAKHFSPSFAIYDQQLLRECLHFQDLDGKYEAAPGEHDDTIFAWSICNQMALQAVKQSASGGFHGVYALGQRQHPT